jgi:hypothetical protein
MTDHRCACIVDALGRFGMAVSLTVRAKFLPRSLSLTISLFFHRRNMAGGPIPASYKVKKNKYIEEWNGRREITEKSFTARPQKVLAIFFYIVVLPLGCYTLTRSEFLSKGDRRYKDMI